MVAFMVLTTAACRVVLLVWLRIDGTEATSAELCGRNFVVGTLWSVINNNYFYNGLPKSAQEEIIRQLETEWWRLYWETMSGLR